MSSKETGGVKPWPPARTSRSSEYGALLAAVLGRAFPLDPDDKFADLLAKLDLADGG